MFSLPSTNTFFQSILAAITKAFGPAVKFASNAVSVARPALVGIALMPDRLRRDSSEAAIPLPFHAPHAIASEDKPCTENSSMRQILSVSFIQFYTIMDFSICLALFT